MGINVRSDDPDISVVSFSHSKDRHNGLKRGGADMDVGSRLKQFRETKGLSQGKIEGRTGLLRCYISRVENGHTLPSVETLEKFARALDMPLYQLLYEGERPPKSLNTQAQEKEDWASRGKGSRTFSKLQNALQKMSVSDRALLLSMAGKMVGKKSRP
jgi:transcriptional regulator with XRE-family HTH domain